MQKIIFQRARLVFVIEGIVTLCCLATAKRTDVNSTCPLFKFNLAGYSEKQAIKGMSFGSSTAGQTCISEPLGSPAQ
jgi:hypothetical protein